MKFFLFALLLFPSLAQAIPITFGFSGTSDQVTSQSTFHPALSDLYVFDALGGPVGLVNLRGYDGQLLNSKDLWLSSGDRFLISRQLTTVSAIIEPVGWLALAL
jgi:hypothetical protein